MDRYKVQTTGKYLVKGEERLMVSDNIFYHAEQLDGFKSKSQRVVVTNIKTREKIALFPGEVINLHPPEDVDYSEMTKAELRELLDGDYPNKATKADLIAALQGEQDG